jgi:hypothetical protein
MGGARFDDSTKFSEGVCIPEKTDDITTAAAPSAAECATAFGAAATHAVTGYHKFLGTIDDGGAGNNSVLVFTDGAAFFFTSLTKAS